MKRNYGIDFLRMTAMLFVAALHIIGIGGVITGAELLSGQFLTAQLLRIAMLCAVDCYALISGYVGWDKKTKLSAIAMLWLRAVIYCAAITAIAARFAPVDLKTALCAVLPVTTGQYWYLTAYVGLFVLQPVLNFAVREMPKRELGMTLAGILILFSVLPISPLTDAFYLHDGYSVLWLCVLYLLGGYVGKYRALERLSCGRWMGIYLGSVLFAYLPRMAVLWRKPIYWSMGYGNILIEYTSPTIVLCALALVAVFSRMKLPRWAEHTVSRLSPHAFGVYLFHAHPLVFAHLLENRFLYLGAGSIPELVLTVLGGALVIYALGTGADWALSALLKCLRIDRLLRRLDKFTG